MCRNITKDDDSGRFRSLYPRSQWAVAHIVISVIGSYHRRSVITQTVLYRLLKLVMF